MADGRHLNLDTEVSHLATLQCQDLLWGICPVTYPIGMAESGP
jgi:hypothetical protein